MVGVRLEPSFRAEIEAWAVRQKDKPTLAEAIRRLIRRGLAPSKRAAPIRTAKLGLAVESAAKRRRK
jgi:hypothetical protein